MCWKKTLKRSQNQIKGFFFSLIIKTVSKNLSSCIKIKNMYLKKKGTEQWFHPYLCGRFLSPAIKIFFQVVWHLQGWFLVEYYHWCSKKRFQSPKIKLENNETKQQSASLAKSVRHAMLISKMSRKGTTRTRNIFRRMPKGFLFAMFHWFEKYMCKRTFIFWSFPQNSKSLSTKFNLAAYHCWVSN